MDKSQRPTTRETSCPEKLDWIPFVEMDRAILCMEKIAAEISKVASQHKQFNDRSASLADFKKWVSAYRDFSSRIVTCRKNNQIVKVGMYGNEGQVNPEEKDSVRESDISKAFLLIDAITNCLFYSRAHIVSGYQPMPILEDKSSIYIPGTIQTNDCYAVLKMKLVDRKMKPASIDYEKLSTNKLMTTSRAGIQDLIIATSLEESKFYTSQIPVGFMWRTIHDMHAAGVFPMADAKRSAQVLVMSFLNLYRNAVLFYSQFSDTTQIIGLIRERIFLFTPQYEKVEIKDDENDADAFDSNTETKAITQGPDGTKEVEYEEIISKYEIAAMKPGQVKKEDEIAMTVFDIIMSEKERLDVYLSEIYVEYEKDLGISGLMTGFSPAIQKTLTDLARNNGLDPTSAGGMDGIAGLLQNAISGITSGTAR